MIVLRRYRKFKIASCGSVTLTEGRKWLRKSALPLQLLPVQDLEIHPVRQCHRRTRGCCSMVARSSMPSCRKVSTNGTHTSVVCSVLVYTLQNIVARAINMSMVYAAAPVVPRTRIGAVTSVIGEYKRIFTGVTGKNIKV